ncbi:hypothetical protein ACFYRC_12365 [Streptomyces sp. NPDC005279]|uniref:hypothetical protein n=1 Tax=Streptomyces sp. NPDC005279 TaxID=3364712 RepID=UPI0036B54C7D
MNQNEEFLLPFELRCARALDELRNAPELHTSEARLGAKAKNLDDPATIFESLAEDEKLPLDATFRQYFFRFNDAKAHWRSPHLDSELVGEFHLTHLYRSIFENHMDDTWEGNNDRERELYRDLRIFDDTPSTGTGRMAALRATPGSTNPEIWYFDMRRGATRMDIGYGSYLDNLLVTKGTIGWQYLFCEVDLGHPSVRALSKGLKEMLDVLPQLFPHYDYSQLLARLEDRL